MLLLQYVAFTGRTVLSYCMDWLSPGIWWGSVDASQERLTVQQEHVLAAGQCVDFVVRWSSFHSCSGSCKGCTSSAYLLCGTTCACTRGIAAACICRLDTGNYIMAIKLWRTMPYNDPSVHVAICAVNLLQN